jgi:hypothetical protein
VFAITRSSARGEIIPGPGRGWTEDLVEIGDVVFTAINTGGWGRAGGVFRSEDGGIHFVRSSNGLPRIHFRSFRPEASQSLFDPYAPISALGVDHGVLLAGTTRMQIFRSEDGGVSFTPAQGLPPPKEDDRWNRIEEFATVSGRTYARTSYKVFQSSDRGATWMQAKLWAPNDRERAIDSFAAEGGLLVAASGGQVIVSENEGADFRATELPGTVSGIRVRNGILYARFLETEAPVYVSRDRGKTFTPRPLVDKLSSSALDVYAHDLKPPRPDPQGILNLLANAHAVLQTKSAHLLATAYGVARTSDRGATLDRVGNGLCGDPITRVGVTDSRVFVHVGGREPSRLYVSPLATADFRSSGYSGNEARAFVTRGKAILVGDEQGRVYQSSDEGATWKDVVIPPTTPPGPVELVGWRGANRLLVRGGILVSRDGGARWKDIRAGFPLEPKEEFGSYEYEVSCGDVTDHAVLLCGPPGVLRGSEKEDWSAVTLPGGANKVVGIASDDGRVYAATANAVYQSLDDGKTFELVATSLPGGLVISHLGAEQGEIAITVENRQASSIAEGTAVLLSRDRGKSWLRLSGGLEFLAASPPVRGKDAWYVGLESDGVFRFGVPAKE